MKRLVLVLAAALLVIGTGAAVVVARQAGSGRSAAGSYRGSEPQPDIRLPSFALREWTGARFDSANVRGKVAVVTFLETKCTEACPVIADQIGIGLSRLSARERASVVALAISTHPHDDTPASVRRFLDAHRVRGALRYLIGSEEQLRPVWRAFKIYPALDSGDADTHSAPVRIFNRQGRWVSTLHPGADLSPANLVDDVRAAMRDGR